MTRAASQEERWDRDRDLRKHEMTPREIAAELDRIEREMRAETAKTQTACKEAMTIIENLMNDLGVPLAKGSTDA